MSWQAGIDRERGTSRRKNLEVWNSRFQGAKRNETGIEGDGMKSTKWLVFLLALVLVASSVVPGVAQAQVRDPRLSDSEEPGSVIVFPKFVKGSVVIDGVAVPRTEIELSVLCPTGTTCTEGTKVKLRGHWVCPGSQDPFSKFVCKETDFNVFTTVNGTVTFNPSRVAVAGGTTVPVAPCTEGYLIMWVVNTSDQPIKFDGLIGDAVIRHNNNSAEAYNAVPIQAHPALASGALITLGADNSLVFDGVAGHYQALPGVVSGTVKFDRLLPAKISSFLTLITMEVLSNRPNFPTFVDFQFWNQAEVVTSTSTDFICWTEVALTSAGDPVAFIDDNLDELGMGSRKGSFLSDPAEKVAIFGVTDIAGPVTLLGIVETQEFTAAGGLDREYSYSMYNDSIPVGTRFQP
jgi:hypothetical protein